MKTSRLPMIPPGRHVVLYDGQCRFCSAQANRLRRWTSPARVQFIDFQRPGVLERFPGLTHDACLRAMHVVTPAGTVLSGCAAIVSLAGTLGIVGPIAKLYYLPGLRWAGDRLYALIAARRYRIMGKEAGACSGACAVHLHARP